METKILNTESVREGLNFVGKSIPRVDGIEKATGELQYVADINLPGMLYGVILGSTQAHARIKRIDTSKAEQLPGVVAVITGKDIPDNKMCTNAGLLPGLEDKLPIEKEKVRFIGDDVAAVAAVDMETAEKALELIEVEYEPLEPILDPEAAMKNSALLVHEDHESNVSTELNYKFGDVDKAFAEADHIFEDVFKTSHVAPCCMETHGCVAKWEKNGRLSIWSTTQLASGLRRELSRVMGISFGDVTVHQTGVGGSFGAKMAMHSLEPIAAHLAKKTGRPVKLYLSRDEEFINSRTRHPSVIRIKTGIKDGKIIAREADAILDNGAYNSQGVTALYKSCTVLCAHYNVPNVRINGYLVYTNKPYGGAFRGFGNPQATFAIESQIDMIAKRLGMDPVEFRLKNAFKPNTETMNGWKISSCGFSECIEKAAEAIDWKNKRGKGKNRGVGLSACIHWGGGISVSSMSNLCSAIIEMNPTGQVYVTVGSHEIGEGANTVITQIVAEELGIPVSDIYMAPVNTDISPSFYFTGSATTFVAGSAAKAAAADLKNQILVAASTLMSVNPNELEIDNGIVRRPSDKVKPAPVSQIARYAYERLGTPLVGKGSFDQGPTEEDIHHGYGQASATYSFVANAVEVEVDPETCAVKVVKWVTTFDCGTVVNPVLAQGQAEGAMAQGLGFALTEGMVVNANGKVMNPSYTDYKVFRSQDMPETVITIPVETVDPRGPYGAKSLGEAVIIPAVAAIASAVEDATGIRVQELPITPEKLSAALDAKK
jgi:CO/xanthine dehydrogenase Mo-binding subunit